MTPPELIPRQILFGNPERAQARLSPDGETLSFLAPEDGVLNIWVSPPDDPAAARPITHDTKRGIREHLWTYTGRHIVYLQDKDGDENWRVYAVDVETAETRDLTPYENVAAQLRHVSHLHPQHILVFLNDRDPALHDAYRIDLLSGERELLLENDGYAGFVPDDDYRIRFAYRMNASGGTEYLRPLEDGSWESFLEVEMEDSLTTHLYDFDRSGNRLYMLDSRERDTAALVELDLTSGASRVLASDPKADVSGVLAHPTEKTIEAVSTNYERVSWQILDDSIGEDLRILEGITRGDVNVTSRTLDDRAWIVTDSRDDGPVFYYHYSRESKEARLLFSNQSSLESLPLVPMHSTVLRSRDELDLVSYLSLPAESDPAASGRPQTPLPLVLSVHGGPWARDSWGFDPTHQWLANRGYAVLSVNFRGSTGFGKAFINAGNGEWSKRMQDDLLDAVEWAVSENIADPDRVAIMGGSYGGYATLVALTMTPTRFACGVDIVGPSNLVTLLSTIPPYWEPMIEMFTVRVGDHRTDEGLKDLREISPLTYADRIQRPLLIAQGANDPRVKQSESDQIVQAMEEKKIPVTYVLYPDEGHGFARPENRLSFFAIVEGFLAEHLGGRVEPIGGDFAGSSVTVPAGASEVRGLSDAIGGD